MEHDQYFVRINDQVYGPAGLERLRIYVAEGRILRGSPVSLDQVRWQTAESLPGLFGPIRSEDERDPGRRPPEPVSPPQDMADLERWHLLLPDQTSMGPISERELMTMVREGHIPPERRVWREGFTDWQPFGQTELGAKWWAEKTSPEVPTPPPFKWLGQRDPGLPPHRGITLLVFALLGIYCCAVFSFVAWLMGNQDIREMREGKKDPSGECLTQVGRIIGIFHSLFVVFLLVFYVMYLIYTAIFAVTQ